MSHEGGSVELALTDRIFLGEGLFETIKVVESKPCYPHLHWQRMHDSAEILGIAFDITLDDWQACILAQIKRDKVIHGGVKVILSGGLAPRGLEAHGQISQIMVQGFLTTQQKVPLRLVSAPWLRDPANPIYQVKSVNYLEAIMARRYAIKQHTDDALFFNTAHHATETTCANVFFIKENMLLTPPKTEGILPGITRARILALAAREGISCKEEPVEKSRIDDMDALFVVNSLSGIQEVCSMDGVSFEVNHPLVQQLNLSLNS